MRFLTLVAAVSLFATPALAEMHPTLPTTTTPLLSFGVGGFDVLDNVEQDRATDFRAEYRFGDPLLYVIKPLVGLEVTSDGSAAVLGGIVADWVIADHYVFAPSFSVAAYHSGAGKEMGSTLEFRSQLEAGYRFDNDMRITGAFSHISNAEIGDKNPGVEIATVYVHIPSEVLLPR